MHEQTNKKKRAQRERGQPFLYIITPGSNNIQCIQEHAKKKQPAFRYLSAQVLDGFWVGLGPHVGPNNPSKIDHKSIPKK